MKRYRIKRGVKSVEANSAEEASRLAFPVKKKRLHISELEVAELRLMLTNAGLDCFLMSDMDVLVECMRTYGHWYEVVSQ